MRTTPGSQWCQCQRQTLSASPEPIRPAGRRWRRDAKWRILPVINGATGGHYATARQGSAADRRGGCDQRRVDGLWRRGSTSVRARGREGGADRHPRRTWRARRRLPPRRGPRRPLPPPRRHIGAELGPGGRRGDGGARTAGYPVQQCRCLVSRQGRGHHRGNLGPRTWRMPRASSWVPARPSRPCAKAAAGRSSTRPR